MLLTLKKMYQFSYSKYNGSYKHKYNLISREIKEDGCKVEITVVVKNKVSEEVVPVFFLIIDKDKGIESPFMYRVGIDSDYQKSNIKSTNIMQAHCSHFWFGYSNILFKYGVYLGNHPCMKQTKLAVPVFDEYGIWVFELLIFPYLNKTNDKKENN